MDSPIVLSPLQRDIVKTMYLIGAPATAGKITERMGGGPTERVRRTITTMVPGLIVLCEHPEHVAGRLIPDHEPCALTTRGLEMIVNIIEAMNPSHPALTAVHRLRSYRGAVAVVQ